MPGSSAKALVLYPGPSPIQTPCLSLGGTSLPRKSSAFLFFFHLVITTNRFPLAPSFRNHRAAEVRDCFFPENKHEGRVTASTHTYHHGISLRGQGQQTESLIEQKEPLRNWSSESFNCEQNSGVIRQGLFCFDVVSFTLAYLDPLAY